MQKDSQMEYIIIDGNSTDNTMNIVHKYKEKIDVIISEPDEGIADAFNKGIHLAKGNVIGLINSDDQLYVGAYNNLKKYLDGNTELYYGDCCIRDVDNHYTKIVTPQKINRIKYAMPFSHQCCFITKEAYDKYGTYDKKYEVCMDYALIRKMYECGAQFKYIPKTLATYSYGGKSYLNPEMTMKENFEIANSFGTSKYLLVYNSLYFILKYKCKKLLEAVGVFKYIVLWRSLKNTKRQNINNK